LSPDARRRRSLRLPGYDYSQSNAYFVTICAAHKKFLCGNIKDGIMRLSEAGQVVAEEWLNTAVIRPYVTLDEFTVMPTHFHGILWVDETPKEGTARRALTMERFGKPVTGSLPTIIGAFKAAVTRRIKPLKNINGGEVWQRGYYEHVIRDDESLNRIREYIMHNPLNWEFDRENLGRKSEDKFYGWLASFKTRPTGKM
jgi:REP element-mobilizing transposase RayT